MAHLSDTLEPGEKVLLELMTPQVVYGWVALFLLAPLWPLAGLLIEFPPGRLSPWTVGVTDRRVIVRKRLFSKHYYDIRLSEISDIRHDYKKRRLLLIGPAHAVEIKCNDKQAIMILEALKGAYNPPRTFWQWLRLHW